VRLICYGLFIICLLGASNTVRSESQIYVSTISEDSLIYNPVVIDSVPTFVEDQTNNTPTIQEVLSVDNPVPTTIEVNQSQLDLILNYLAGINLSASEDSVVISEYLSGFDSQSLASFWEMYKSGDFRKTDQTSSASIPTSQTETNQSALETEYTGLGVVNKELTQAEDGTIIYRIQLAAGLDSVSSDKLNEFNTGSLPIEHAVETGWHKYTIGNFGTYAEADEYKTQQGLREALIVAYTRPKPTEVIPVPDIDTNTSESNQLAENNNTETPSVNPSNSTELLSAEIWYSIQIGAFKKQPEATQIERLYSGNLPVNMREENGFYKYLAGQFSTLDEAKIAKKEIPVAQSFIVAYRNNQRVSVTSLRAGNSTVADTQQILYVVQLAASKVQMPESELKELYSGSLSIREWTEDGWYKYQIVAGSEYIEARKIKKEVTIKGSFIAAYHNGKRIPLYKAILNFRY